MKKTTINTILLCIIAIMSVSICFRRDITIPALCFLGLYDKKIMHRFSSAAFPKEMESAYIP